MKLQFQHDMQFFAYFANYYLNPRYIILQLISREYHQIVCFFVYIYLSLSPSLFLSLSIFLSLSLIYIYISLSRSVQLNRNVSNPNCLFLSLYLTISLSLSLFLSLFLKNMHGFNEKFVSLISYYLLIINYQSNPRYLVLQLIIKIALPYSATYHF